MKPTFHPDRYPDQGFAQVEPDALGVHPQHVLLKNGGDLLMDNAQDFTDQIDLGLRVISAAQPIFAQFGPATVMLRGVQLDRTAPPLLYFEVLVGVHHGVEIDDHGIIDHAHRTLGTGQPMDFRVRLNHRHPNNPNNVGVNTQLFRTSSVSTTMRDMDWQV